MRGPCFPDDHDSMVISVEKATLIEFECPKMEERDSKDQSSGPK